MRTRWMQEQDQEPSDAEIHDEILRLLMIGGRDDTICPTDVARSLRDHWRQWMPLVREVAAEMVREGKIVILQNGQAVDAELAKGPIRLKLVRN
jgi:hypothetical protein